MGRFIPLSIPNFEGNERKYLNDALQQGWVSTGGMYVKKFERDLAKFLHLEDIVACQSGTAALHLSLIEAGIGPNDIVLVPPVTFIAAVNPIKYQFAKPVFIDCDDSLCMDPIKLNDFCAEQCEFKGGSLFYKRQMVKAVVVVHVFGNMADMESIMNVAERFNLKVIEDATEALGTCYTKGKYIGKYAGTIGHFGAYSFNGNKIITTGGGGAVTANKLDSIEHMRYLSTQAKDDPYYYIHNEIGYNYRMTNLQAALGVAQMEELPEFIIRKQKYFSQYKDEFSSFEFGEIMPFREGTSSNSWLCSFKINIEKIGISMCETIAAMEERGIQTRAIWGLINEQKPYKNEFVYKLEKAPYYTSRILNIPSSTQLLEEDIHYVAEELKQFIKDKRNV